MSVASSSSSCTSLPQFLPNAPSRCQRRRLACRPGEVGGGLLVRRGDQTDRKPQAHGLKPCASRLNYNMSKNTPAPLRRGAAESAGRCDRHPSPPHRHPATTRLFCQYLLYTSLTLKTSPAGSRRRGVRARWAGGVFRAAPPPPGAIPLRAGRWKKTSLIRA